MGNSALTNALLTIPNDGSVTTGKIADGAVTGAKIADGTITNIDLSAACISGNNIAAQTVLGGHLVPNTITNSHLALSSISGGTIQANSIQAGHIANNGILNSNLALAIVSGSTIASSAVSAGHFIGEGYPTVAEGRLSLVSGTPIFMGNVTGATVYYTPYAGNKISLWDTNNNKVNVFKFTELSRTTSNISAGSASANAEAFDLFIYNNNGTPAIEGCKWTSQSARAAAISINSGTGFYTKTCDATRRYIGSVETEAGNQFLDTEGVRGVWNMYNRVQRNLLYQFTSDSWSHSTATFTNADTEHIGAAGNVVVFFGLQLEPMHLSWQTSWANNQAANTVGARIGISPDDGGTVISQQTPYQYNAGVNHLSAMRCEYVGNPALGRSRLNAVNAVDAVGTTVWYGDVGVAYVKSALQGYLWG